MAEQTANYGLPTGVRADEFIDPEHHNGLANVFDQVIGGVLGSLFQSGAHSGWLLTTDGSATPGCGLVGVHWCESAEASAIAGLTPGAINHVWAVPLGKAATPGDVRFVAQLAPPGPGGAVYLGTMSLDAGGGCNEINNCAPGVQRSCFRMAFGRASGTVCTRTLEPGEREEVVVDHSRQVAFRVPGDLRVELWGTGASWRITQHHSGAWFALAVANESEASGAFTLAWAREGLVA